MCYCTINRENIKTNYGIDAGLGPLAFSGSDMVLASYKNGRRIERINLETYDKVGKPEATQESGLSDKIKLTYLQCPRDNLQFVLMGFSNGRVDIRDTATLRTCYFSHEFQGGPIEWLGFYLDTFANLSIMHKDKSVYNLILERTG